MTTHQQRLQLTKLYRRFLRGGAQQALIVLLAAFVMGSSTLSAWAQTGGPDRSFYSPLRQDSPLAAQLEAPKPKQAGPSMQAPGMVKPDYATITTPQGSSTPWNNEWSCYTLSGPITDTVSNMYYTTNPPGRGISITNIPSSVNTYVWFTVDVNVASNTPPGTYGFGIFGNGLPQYYGTCGAELTNGETLYSNAAYAVVPGSKDNLGCPYCKAGNQAAVGDPINVTVGNVYEDELDFKSNIGTLPLKIERNFNTQNGIVGWFGHNWTSNIDAALFGSPTSACTVRLPDGQEIGFTTSNSGTTWVPTTQVPVTLTTNASGYLAVRTDTNDSYQFNSLGQIISQTNVRGETLTYTRNPANTNQITAITDAYGNSMSLSWNTYSNGYTLVHTITAFGQTYTYSYNTTTFNLTSVSYTLDVDGKETTVERQYQYNNTANVYDLTDIFDENNNDIAHFGYDSNDLPNHSDSAGTESENIDYTNLYSSSPSVTVTNANGYEQVYTIAYNADGTAYIPSIAGVAGSGNNNVTPATTYTVDNSQDQPSITVDGNGHATQYAYDPTRSILTLQTNGYQWNGSQPITASTLTPTNAMSQMQVTKLDPVFPYPDQIVYSATNAQGTLVNTKRVDEVYDPTNGRLTSWTETDLTNYTTPYTTNNNTRNWTYQYTYYDTLKTQPKSEAIYGPRYSSTVNDLTTLQFDSAGHLTSKTDGSGHSWAYSNLNALGMPQTIKDNQNNVTTTVTYDEKNRVTSTTIASGTSAAELEQLTYYANGWLQETMRPDGSYLEYKYDGAGHLNEIDDSAGNKTQLTPNPLDGQWTTLNIVNSSATTVQTATRAFDDIGRLLQVLGSTQDVHLQNSWDLANNLQNSYEDGDVSTELTRVYDALNRVQQLQHQPVGGGTLGTYTLNGYDPTGAINSVTDPRGVTTTYQIDGLGNVMLQQSPDTNLTQLWHDAAGNTTQREDAKSQVLKYQYDALNRLFQITRGDTGAVQATYTYDQTDSAHTYGYGRLTSMSDLSGTTNFAYDPVGHLLGKTQVTNGVTLETSYTYYAGTDDVETMTLPSGNKLGYTWDTNGHVDKITLTKSGSTKAANLVSAISYQPFGGPLKWTLGNGTVDSRTYDGDGYVSADPVENSILYYPNKTRLQSMTLGGASNIVYTGARSFGYDNFEHVTSLSGSVAASGGTAQSLSLAYQSDDADNRLSETLAGTSTTFTPASTSNRLVSTTSGSTTTNYHYDLNGSITGTSTTPTYGYDFFNRLTTYKKGTTSASYVYNGRGERVQKSVGSTTTYFVFDEGGHLIGEYNGSTPIEETVYLGNMPVAVQEPSGTYYVHADYRNVPRQIDNAKKKAVWAWDPEVFGDTKPDQKPTGSTSTFAYNLRFPGQYYDAESGNFYNKARDYSPTLARYVQSDSFGLAAGVNTYAYVKGNPVNLTDRTGFICDGCEVPPAMAQAFASPDAGAIVIPAATIAASFLPVSDLFDGLLLWNKLAKARRLGKAGEKAVCKLKDIGSKQKIKINGRNRIPDGLTDDTLSEVKNVESLSYTQQLQDFADYAAQEDLDFDLYVRPDTYLSGPLFDAEAAGDINIIRIPMR